jgi:hypothetical protein
MTRTSYIGSPRGPARGRRVFTLQRPSSIGKLTAVKTAGSARLTCRRLMVVRRVRPGALPQHLLERRWPSVLLQEIAERFLTDLVFGRDTRCVEGGRHITPGDGHRGFLAVAKIDAARLVGKGHNNDLAILADLTTLSQAFD